MTEVITSRAAEGATRPRRTRWLVPAGLVFLSLVPVLAGAMRLTELAGSPAVTASNERFVLSPVPVVIHIIAASLFCVIGAFQFVPSLRRGKRGRPSWHKIAGRVILVPAGLLAAGSGLWMTIFYPHTWADGGALFVIRILVASTMATGIVVALVAARRNDFTTHSAWMTRAYALGLGAGTQVFTFLPWTLTIGAPDPTVTAVLMAAGWAINLAVAEYVIRRRARHTTGRNVRGVPRIMSA
jgi:uncharacterized membrane protein